MKYLRLTFCVSLIAGCVFQVEGSSPGRRRNFGFGAIKDALDAFDNKKEGYTKLPKYESCSSEDEEEWSTSSSLSMEQDRAQRLKVEMSPPGSYFEMNGIYLDKMDPGIRPNDQETLYRFEAALSGVTHESLLKALGLDGTPVDCAKTLRGLLLGQARGRINYQTAIVFLEIFSQANYAYETVLALKTISSVMENIKTQPDQKKERNTIELFPQAIEKYYDGLLPPTTKLWATLSPLIDQLLKRKGDEEAAKNIMDVLASKFDAEFGYLERIHPRRQEEKVETVIEHVVRYGMFLNRIRGGKQDGITD